jgi:hypothetical protein
MPCFAEPRRKLPRRECRCVSSSPTQWLKDWPSQPTGKDASSWGWRHLRKETARINRLIELEFEAIEPEDRA